MVWIIKCWIPIETEKEQMCATKEETESTIESLRLMQPENRYIVAGDRVMCYIPVDPPNILPKMMPKKILMNIVRYFNLIIYMRLSRLKDDSRRLV